MSYYMYIYFFFGGGGGDIFKITYKIYILLLTE